MKSQPGIINTDLRKKILLLAFPAIAEMLLHMMVGIVDTAMVGRLGAQSLAAVGLANQLFGFGTTIFSGIATGSTAIVARCVGAKDYALAGKATRQSLLFGIVLSSVVMVLLLLFGGSLLSLLFGSMEEMVLQLGSQYVRIVSSTLVFHFVLILINGSLRGAGDTTTPMVITAIMNLVNILGNYLLIFGVGPFPALGVEGAAISTAIAQVLGAILAVAALIRSRFIRIDLGRPYSFDVIILKKILNTGIPIALEQGGMRVVQLLFTMIITSLGTVSYAAFQVATQAESLSFMPSFGFSLATMTLVGQSLGAHQPDLAEEVATEARKYAVWVTSIMAVVFLIFAERLVGIFTDDPQVIRLAALGLRIVAFAQPSLGATGVLTGGLRAAGDSKWVLVVTTTSYIFARLGVAYLLAIGLGYGLPGAWFAMTFDTFVRWFVLRKRYNRRQWKLLSV